MLFHRARPSELNPHGSDTSRRDVNGSCEVSILTLESLRNFRLALDRSRLLEVLRPVILVFGVFLLDLAIT